MVIASLPCKCMVLFVVSRDRACVQVWMMMTDLLSSKSICKKSVIRDGTVSGRRSRLWVWAAASMHLFFWPQVFFYNFFFGLKLVDTQNITTVRWVSVKSAVNYSAYTKMEDVEESWRKEIFRLVRNTRKIGEKRNCGRQVWGKWIS
jgi:hypothetical protein